MAKKKKKKSTSARRTRTGRKPSSSDAKEAERILTIWRKAAKVGLGGKRFARAITTRYEPRLRNRILTRLGLRDRTQAAVYAHDQGILHQ